MAVHHIDMDIVCPGAGDRADFITQRRKVGGQDGGGDSDGFLHGV